ncbi:MAG: tRNA modification GTPase [Planctomycetota bacterium]
MINHAARIDDTIVAIATPPGGSERAVIRLSGAESLSLAMTLCGGVGGAAPSLSAYGRGRVEVSLSLPGVTPTAPQIDLTVALYLLPAPKTYTRQDVVELHLPGSPALVQLTLDALVRAGARLADPGEFTLRAFLNGRIDLAQAEAVEAIIRAGSEGERRTALSRVEGLFSDRIVEWREGLIRVAGELEGQLDFEADEVDPQEEEAMRSRLDEIRGGLSELVSLGAARVQTVGRIPVLFAGLTNAGKSSLVNSLLGYEAAVVSEERSTTRDRLDFEWTVEPFHFLLQDAPGRDEGEGRFAAWASERGSMAGDTAGVLVLTLDRGVGPDDSLRRLIDDLPPVPTLVALHKSDTPTHPDLDSFLRRHERLSDCPRVETSSLGPGGVESLRQALVDLAVEDMEHVAGQTGFPVRVVSELQAAEVALRQAEELLTAGLGYEMVAEEIRRAHAALGHILGEGYAEEVLESIFSRFCIGK